MPGHKGGMENKLADYMAKKGTNMGRGRNIATPAGIRHHVRITHRTKQGREWDRNTLRGYTYIYTDKDPFMHWLHRIGRKESSLYSCGGGGWYRMQLI